MILKGMTTGRAFFIYGLSADYLGIMTLINSLYGQYPDFSQGNN